MEVAELVAEAGGIASRRLLLGLGATRAQLAAAGSSGQVVDHGRGGYALPGLSKAFGVAARVRGEVACVSALREHGLQVPEPDVPHIVVAGTCVAAGAVWHRGTVDSPLEALVPASVRAVHCLPRREGLAVLDAVLRADGVTKATLREALGQRPGPAARWALRYADPRADSRLESLARAALIDGGILGYDLQAELPGIGRVDFLIDGWLIVEADGFAYHRERADYRNDRRRGATATRQGFLTLRFGWEDVVGSPEQVAQTVRSVLARRRRSAFQTVI